MNKRDKTIYWVIQHRSTSPFNEEWLDSMKFLFRSTADAVLDGLKELKFEGNTGFRLVKRIDEIVEE